MTLETPNVLVQKSTEELYNFLSDFKNFEQIMPENIETFELRENGFVFGLKGMPKIKLKLVETTPFSKIVLGSAAEQFPFTLVINIEQENSISKANFKFNGKFNAMMKMMVKKPLKKFIDTLSENLEKLS